jgi:hypothetical protein
MTVKNQYIKLAGIRYENLLERLLEETLPAENCGYHTSDVNKVKWMAEVPLDRSGAYL